MFDFALEGVAVLLELLVPVLKDLELILHGGQNDFGIFLEILELLHQFLVFLSGQLPQIVEYSKVLHPRNELSHFPFRRTFENEPVDERNDIDLEVHILHLQAVQQRGVGALVGSSGGVDGGLVDAVEGATHAFA